MLLGLVPYDPTDRRPRSKWLKEKASIEDSVARLGPTVRDAMKVLADENVRGVPLSPSHCVIAEYLRTHHPKWSFSVDRHRIVATRYTIFSTRHIRIATPEHLVRVVYFFDVGQMPCADLGDTPYVWYVAKRIGTTPYAWCGAKKIEKAV